MVSYKIWRVKWAKAIFCQLAVIKQGWLLLSSSKVWKCEASCSRLRFPFSRFSVSRTRVTCTIWFDFLISDLQLSLSVVVSWVWEKAVWHCFFSLFLPNFFGSQREQWPPVDTFGIVLESIKRSATSFQQICKHPISYFKFLFWLNCLN